MKRFNRWYFNRNGFWWLLGCGWALVAASALALALTNVVEPIVGVIFTFLGGTMWNLILSGYNVSQIGSTW